MNDEIVKPKVVMALSGGMDSATVLGILLQQGYDVEVVSFAYGSKHGEFEIEAARKIADHYGVHRSFVDMTVAFDLFSSNLLRSGGDIPEGHYQAENMKATVVPFRNTIMAAVLAGRAESIGAKYIALGVHQGDHHIYPDCRTSYIKLLDSLIYNASEEKIEVLTPVLDGNKIDILRTGFTLGVPYELTRTCYKDQQISCGKCGSCQERIEAFQAHKVKDPIPYEIAIVWECDVNEPIKE